MCEVFDVAGQEIRFYHAEDNVILADRRLTITEATIFYLKEDPISSLHASSYHQNLICIFKLRWYLQVLLGMANISNKLSYNFIRANCKIIKVK